MKSAASYLGRILVHLAAAFVVVEIANPCAACGGGGGGGGGSSGGQANSNNDLIDTVFKIMSYLPPDFGSIGEGIILDYLNNALSQGLGGNMKASHYADAANRGVIKCAGDLNCSFDRPCRWRNDKDTDLRYFTGTGKADQQVLDVLTGVWELPRDPFVIGAGNEGSKAAWLVSDPIPPQPSATILQFKVWVTPLVQFTVCTREVGSKKFTFCSPPFESGSGKEDPRKSVRIPAMPAGDKQFEIVLQTSNFIVSPGGLSLLDDISYDDFSNCTSADGQALLEVVTTTVSTLLLTIPSPPSKLKANALSTPTTPASARPLSPRDNLIDTRLTSARSKVNVTNGDRRQLLSANGPTSPAPPKSKKSIVDLVRVPHDDDVTIAKTTAASRTLTTSAVSAVTLSASSSSKPGSPFTRIYPSSPVLPEARTFSLESTRSTTKTALRNSQTFQRRPSLVSSQEQGTLFSESERIPSPGPFSTAATTTPKRTWRTFAAVTSSSSPTSRVLQKRPIQQTTARQRSTNKGNQDERICKSIRCNFDAGNTCFYLLGGYSGFRLRRAPYDRIENDADHAFGGESGNFLAADGATSQDIDLFFESTMFPVPYPIDVQFYRWQSSARIELSVCLNTWNMCLRSFKEATSGWRLSTFRITPQDAAFIKADRVSLLFLAENLGPNDIIAIDDIQVTSADC